MHSPLPIGRYRANAPQGQDSGVRESDNLDMIVDVDYFD